MKLAGEICAGIAIGGVLASLVIAIGVAVFS